MGKGVAAAAILVWCLACTGGPPASAPVASTAPSSNVSFPALAGAYRSESGATYVLNGLGQLVRLDDGWIRQLDPGAGPGHFTFGPAFMTQGSPQGEVTVAGGALTIGSTAARLQPVKRTDVRVASAGGVMLAGTITEPVTPGPHPGIVVVHGSEAGTRILYGVWAGLYAALGMAVLSYDKRGNGGSTGVYPGEVSTTASLNAFADDAAACARFLAAWPGVDPRRVGFHGGSQGGWTVPLAIQRFPAAAFAVLLSAPAVSVGQQTVWSLASGDASFIPSESPEEIAARMRAASSDGYQPRAALLALRAPVLWLNGETDRHVPTAFNLSVLRSMHKSNFDLVVLPGVSHGLLENASGLDRDDPKATRLAPDLFTRIAAWLVIHARAAGSI